MTDQAQGLRDLMAGVDHAATLPVESHAGMDYEKLWKGLKDELEGETVGKWRVIRPMRNLEPGQKGIVGIYDDTPESVDARKFLDRMERAETLAMVRGMRA